MIKAINLSKTFTFDSDRPQSLKTTLVNIFKSGRGQRIDYVAFSNLNFEIGRGEFVGIMGKNGAGKSTLLRLIAGIYEPTVGSILVEGKVAPLIELGAGFNPELSGYENIFLNAAILGFGRSETKEAVELIIEFSELGDHIYTPIKKYSSGMLVRLGFAIATHLRAPILLIDEVLAVGDLKFQKKCLSKIKSLHREGRTIILITHNPDDIELHCDRCIVIFEKTKIFDGNPAEGAELYKKINL